MPPRKLPDVKTKYFLVNMTNQNCVIKRCYKLKLKKRMVLSILITISTLHLGYVGLSNKIAELVILSLS